MLISQCYLILRLLCSTEKSINVVLATSLVHFFPPKHHARALRIIDQLLQQDPDNVPSLMGRGYIFQHNNNWIESASLFARVVELSPEDSDKTLRAKEEHAWCMVQLRKLEQGVQELQDTLSAFQSYDGKDEDKARCQWRLGKAHWEIGGQCRLQCRYCITHM
jgi:superkiller protein 3